MAEGESRRISENHWSWRSRLARMAKNGCVWIELIFAETENTVAK